MFSRRHNSPPTPVVLVLGRTLGAVLAGAGTLANFAIKDLWQHRTASLPLAILLAALIYGAIIFAQLQGVRMLVASTPADLSFTPRLRLLGIGVVVSMVLADALIVVAAILGLM